MATEVILHHYDGSPYSEKIRLLLGYEQLSWRSVIMPAVLPKTDLFTLTHGYRRAPVMQIGADIYCDSALIADEIERRYPNKPISNSNGVARLLGHWVDVEFFWLTVRYVMGKIAQQIPQALLNDRIAMHEQFNFDRQKLVDDLPQLASQIRPLLTGLDMALDEHSYIGGDTPSIADFSLYHPLWFLNSVDVLTEFTCQGSNLHDWFVQMGAFGHGSSRMMTSAEAIKIAAANQPAVIDRYRSELGIVVGAWVSVTPQGYPKEVVCGRLVNFSESRITIAQESPETGLVHIHLPRLTYTVQTLDSRVKFV